MPNLFAPQSMLKGARVPADPPDSRSPSGRTIAGEWLDAETEAGLARNWRDEGDERALHRLVTAYMRLAISMAMKYRRYGPSLNDLIQEAGVGLMKAAYKFDPDRGVRFSTYAIWWIKASIQDYVMRDYSMVRTGSTSAQKALFFNMRRVRANIETRMRADGLDPAPPEIRSEIAREMGVRLRDVDMMDARLTATDFSLNAVQSGDESREWIETLEDEAPRAEDHVAWQSDIERARLWVCEALEILTPRERLIIDARKLAEQPRTLADLSAQLGLSKERVRQLETRALQKMRRRLTELHSDEVAEMTSVV